MPTFSEPLEKIYKNDYSSSPDADADEGGDNPFPKWIEGVDTTYAPYLPTSLMRLSKCLKMADVGPNDVLLDLGSGDGRFCGVAVREFGVRRAIGVESDEELVEISKDLAERALTLADTPSTSNPYITRCEFHAGDLRDSSLHPVITDPSITVLVIFMSPEFAREHEHLILKHYNRGARIVSGVFDMSDLSGLKLKCKDDPDGIFVYEKP
ncbi:hypothetical protein HK097_009560 [Rhizophlyctis rosea]|uniref:DOT1 domain-containing protein n=1 Tax=Rhizophlyctis rosea TaxID=64517 RepID=A0AAD5X348_9FUNG|nr:hypothetical protein HK097_009560 [Rhizophlyctis rosea]